MSGKTIDFKKFNLSVRNKFLTLTFNRQKDKLINDKIISFKS